MTIGEHPIWNVAFSAVVVGIGIYVAIAALMYIFQSRLLFFPRREIVWTPGTVGLRYEDVMFTAPDGPQLHGWFVPSEGSRGVILFCHGNGGNISYLVESLQLFHRLGFSTFAFDYRGYGRSEGSPSEDGTYSDAQGALQYLTEEKKIAPADITLVGRSLGGAVAAWLATTTTPRALILESSFTSLPDIAADAYPMFPARVLSRFRYATIDYLQDVHCPVLVVHSTDDEIIPFEHGQRLFASAKNPKRFLEISGGHNEGFFVSAPRYQKGIEDFLSIGELTAD